VTVELDGSGKPALAAGRLALAILHARPAAQPASATTLRSLPVHPAASTGTIVLFEQLR